MFITITTICINLFSHDTYSQRFKGLTEPASDFFTPSSCSPGKTGSSIVITTIRLLQNRIPEYLTHLMYCTPLMDDD